MTNPEKLNKKKVMNLYFIKITRDDGQTWEVLTKLGYFHLFSEAQVHANHRNAIESGELTRYGVEQVKDFDTLNNIDTSRCQICGGPNH